MNAIPSLDDQTQAPLQSRLVQAVERLERWTPALLAIVLACTGYVDYRLAFRRRLWLDEIMTTLIVKLPTFRQIWAVCSTGADNQPPAYDYLLHETVRLMGNDALGVRLPSLVGYLLGAFCLYWFVRSCTGVRLYGFAAMLLSLLSGSSYYATEGRPYGLLFGLAALAAVCWQFAIRQRARPVALASFALVLAASLNLHYYATLLFLPFAVAELVRTRLRGKLDIWFWVAWATPALALLPYLSLIRANRTRTGIPDAYFAKPEMFLSLRGATDLFLAPAAAAVVAAGVIYLLGYIVESRRPSQREAATPRSQYFYAESALIVGFLLTPIAGILLSIFGTHIFFPRYLIVSMFGVSALIGIGFALACRRQPAAACLLCLVFGTFLGNCLYDEALEARWWAWHPAPREIVGRIPPTAMHSGMPIVVPYLDDFMQLTYYGDASLRSRLFYLSSEALAKQHLGFTFHERMMMGASPFFGTNVVPYEQFVTTHRSFYISGGLTTPDWIVPQLLTQGAHLQLLQGGIASPDGSFYVPFLRAEMPPR